MSMASRALCPEVEKNFKMYLIIFVKNYIIYNICGNVRIF